MVGSQPAELPPNMMRPPIVVMAAEVSSAHVASGKTVAARTEADEVHRQAATDDELPINAWRLASGVEASRTASATARPEMAEVQIRRELARAVHLGAVRRNRKALRDEASETAVPSVGLPRKLVTGRPRDRSAVRRAVRAGLERRIRAVFQRTGAAGSVRRRELPAYAESAAGWCARIAPSTASRQALLPLFGLPQRVLVRDDQRGCTAYSCSMPCSAPRR
jgi:hypothetical protein